MIFVPRYTVSYDGVYHAANVPFEIRAGDAEMMRKHGVITEPAGAEDSAGTDEDDILDLGPEKPAERKSRTKK